MTARQVSTPPAPARAPGGRAEPGPGELSLAVVVGQLARPARHRILPSGDSLVEYEVTVRRPGQPTETVPVVWPKAPPSALDLDTGRAVVVVGRVRRRFFRAGAATGSRTEVVADRVVARSQRRRVRAVLAAAEARLGDACA